MGFPSKIIRPVSDKNRSLLQLKEKELDIQKSFVKWLKYKYPKVLFSASAGGMHTSKSQAGKMKAAGYTKGCPDIMIFEPNGQYCGLFIELKRKSGRASPEQITFIEGLKARGYRAAVCYGYEEITREVDEYFMTRYKH
jgi:hypothetical protein